MDSATASPASTARSDALSRATALASRASELRRAQGEVQDLTSREVQMLARTAASFFDAIPLPEFTASLLPLSARQLRRMRHRILHRTVHTTASGTLIHAMLLGRDGVLRLFSARTADSRDLLRSLEPGRPLPSSVVRDVVEWTPTLRVSGFRPFEILEKLSRSLDAVEAQIADAEEKVQVQKQALATGDLTALLPGRAERGARPPVSSGTIEAERDAELKMLAAFDAADAADAVQGVETVDAVEASGVVEPLDFLDEAAILEVLKPLDVASVPAAPSPVAAPPTAESLNPFDIFEVVEAVAASAGVRAVHAPPPVLTPAPPSAPAAPLRNAIDAEPEEWAEPAPSANAAAARDSLFPVLPPPR